MYIHEYIFYSNFETANDSTASAFHNNHIIVARSFAASTHTHRPVDRCVCVCVFV